MVKKKRGGTDIITVLSDIVSFVKKKNTDYSVRVYSV